MAFESPNWDEGLDSERWVGEPLDEYNFAEPRNSSGVNLDEATSLYLDEVYEDITMVIESFS